MPEPLTAIERKIFDYMVDYLRTNTYQPSIREIGREFAIKSTKTVAEHLQSLADKGWVERDPSRSRGVHLVGVEVYPDFIRVPCYQSVDGDGDELPAATDLEFQFDRRLAGCDDAFLLHMADDSLDGDGIHGGDLLLVERTDRDAVEAGEIVVGRLSGKGTVKRLRTRGDGYSLEAANDRFPAVEVRDPTEFTIFGRVVGVYRQTRPTEHSHAGTRESTGAVGSAPRLGGIRGPADAVRPQPVRGASPPPVVEPLP